MKTYLALLALLFTTSAAQAGVRIVPESSGASQLRASLADLDVTVNPAAALARVTSTSVFENTSPKDFEAEFLALAPDNSIITQFSYWYKGQKTLARIVENQRAAQIYEEATSAYRPKPRDPALVEMLARNKFRVRVAPVEAKKPLKIEIVWWQPLEKQDDQWRLRLPWRDSGPAFNLDGLSARVRFSSPVEHLESPFPEAKTTPRSWEVTKAAGQAPEDSLLTFESAEKPVVLVSRSGGSGYFATIVVESDWKNWERWRSYHALHSHALGDGRRIVTGRTDGASPAKDLGYGEQNDTEASEKWWASLELDEKGKKYLGFSQYKEVIELSKRYNLPSTWTSWLAIPDSERAKLADIIDREKIEQATYDRERLGPALAAYRGAGKANTAQYRAMLAAFKTADALAKRNKNSVFDHAQLNDFFTAEAQRLSDNMNGVREAQWARETQRSIFALLQGVPNSGDLLKQTNQRVALAVQGEKENRQSLALAQGALKGVLAGAPSAKFESRIRHLGLLDGGLLSDEIARVALNRVKLAQSQPAVSRQLDKLLQLWVDSTANAADRKASRDYYLQNAEEQLFGSRVQNLRQALGEEIVAKRENGPRYAQLSHELTGVISASDLHFQSDEPELGQALKNAQEDLERAQNAASLDEVAIGTIKAELERLRSYVSPKTFADATADSGSMYSTRYDEHGLNYVATQWVLAVKKGGVDSSDAVRLKKSTEEWAKHVYEEYYPGRQKKEVDFALLMAERTALMDTATTPFEQWASEKAHAQPDTGKLAAIEGQWLAMQEATIYNKTFLTEEGNRQWRQRMVLERVEGELDTELDKPTPAPDVVAALTDRLAEVAPDADGTYQRQWTGTEQNELRGNAHDYAQLRVKRIGLRAKAMEAKRKLVAKPTAPEKRVLEQEIAQWQKIDNQLSVRMGDPLIAVAAPQTARQVLALFPYGEIKKLAWNDLTSRWEARFDVPTWASEGDYAVKIVVVFASGARQQLTMHFAVDMKAPDGVAKLASEGANWNLRLESDAQTDRVTAFLPWNERTELRRGSDGVFAAGVAVPPEFRGAKAAVRFVLTDKAHNRTEINVEWP